VNHLEAALAARAFTEGRGIRSALFRHRRLLQRPIAVVAYQLGAEPFSASALGWGDSPDGLHLGVAGEPRNRDLAFALLLRFARWFNDRFERPRVGAQQVIVANAATADMLGRLGRRLASPGVYDESRDEPVGDSAPWPSAAYSKEGRAFLANVSTWPVHADYQNLADFLAHPVTPLSERAAAGFLSRAESSTLRFPDGLLDAVRRHLAARQEAAP
jgi:hypothetical protein